ncbi:sporulation histidine kinase inhibitor Sda [Evansella sp. LMS18]|uniref:sporulation histidine kinase inhibitor Sda n=1 Tax=Evansella sp. LMS18 TaxID=2924033 RepID=UPI0020D0F6DB|nr:sporulation histidine kinase inhibitor Sda [Evansella sp. LMS18]UTR11989.1 sporulation histidine kinase inhibitor Sda [Evansella sp. LMS18]
MRTLADKELKEAYIKACEQNLDPLFILQLRKELERRQIIREALEEKKRKRQI